MKREKKNEITHTHTNTYKCAQNEIERERAMLTVYATKEKKEIKREQYDWLFLLFIIIFFLNDYHCYNRQSNCFVMLNCHHH